MEMAIHVGHLFHFERSIHYKFSNSLLLHNAFTAPGAEGAKDGTRDEQELYDGNRTLAKVGDYVHRFIVARRAEREQLTRSWYLLDPAFRIH